MNKWIDISQPLSKGMAVWPGDTPFSYEVSWPYEESGSVNVGKLEMSTHTGTHIDAPFHFDNEGIKVIDLDINLYIGEAEVIYLPGVSKIGIEELTPKSIKGVTRLIIRTDHWKDKRVFPESIPYVEPEAAVLLAENGVRLLGLDLPSVDQLDSKELPAHHMLSKNSIHILEGLVLDEIEEGRYELAALPLPITEGDGSPVRAVLRKK
ncbi:arylformamidase [Peribacillus deserti]|uniref:Kynurenine formamidase n=1 Tax=Peribacillus deserti TaxID=673318 RepID=A0ABS2QDV8_9BACI|nr:arylformamidase [Peribacillus deserti]MBM7691318.1 arylformamidase [Peribacillus deserti]